MNRFVTTTLLVFACVIPRDTLAAPAEAFLNWTVSPGTYQNGVWTIPGTTTLTASVVDVSGQPITVGTLYWQVCTSRKDLSGQPTIECSQSTGPVKWVSQVLFDLSAGAPTPISPCLCAGDQVGFRLYYRSSKGLYKSVIGDAFDLFAETSCPTRSCP